MKFQDWFQVGMKRELADLKTSRGLIITVGGSEVTDNKLYRPHWDALNQNLPYVNSSVGTIWCDHFLEHLPGNRAIEMLREFERILIPGGIANIVVPYYNSNLQAQDLDHKSSWNENSWNNLFNNQYYSDHGDWMLKVNFCLIAGIVERNLCLFTQLEKS